jgi:hypothetical protein
MASGRPLRSEVDRWSKLCCYGPSVAARPRTRTLQPRQWSALPERLSLVNDRIQKTPKLGISSTTSRSRTSWERSPKLPHHWRDSQRISATSFVRVERASGSLGEATHYGADFHFAEYRHTADRARRWSALNRHPRRSANPGKAERTKRGSPVLVRIGSANGPAFIGKAEVTSDAAVRSKASPGSGPNQGGSFSLSLIAGSSDAGSGGTSTIFSSSRSITRRMLSSGTPSPSGSVTATFVGTSDSQSFRPRRGRKSDLLY